MKTVAKPKVFISYTWRSDDPSNPKEAEKRGLELADRLRDAGLDSRIDKYFLYSLHGFVKPQRRPGDKVEPWVIWAGAQIQEADFVLLMCSAQYAATVCKSPLWNDSTGKQWPDVPDDLKFKLQEPDLTWEHWQTMPDDLKFKLQEYQLDENEEKKKNQVPYTWWDWHFMIQDMESGRTAKEKFIPVGFGPYSSVSQHVPYFIKGESYHNLDSDEDFEGLVRGIKAQFRLRHPREPASSTIQEVVLLIHGIRDFAEWQHKVSPILKEISNKEVWPLSYGRFDALKFWFPLWTRRAPIRKILRRIRDAHARNPSAKLSVIAHSFGTYAIGEILSNNPEIELHRLILCGAILPTEFGWDKLRKRIETEVINDCGIRDIWPVLAQSTTFGYGPSGRFGFGTPGVRDRFHNFGHGGFFEEKFVRKFWLPWFRMGQLVNSEAPPPSGTRWHLLTIIQIKWLAILLCAAGILWFSLATILEHAYQKPLQTSKTEDVSHAAAIPTPSTPALSLRNTSPTATPTPPLAQAYPSQNHWATTHDQIGPLWKPIAYQVKNSFLATSFVPDKNESFLIYKAIMDTKTTQDMLSGFQESVSDAVLAKWFIALDDTLAQILSNLGDVDSEHRGALDIRAVNSLAPSQQRALQLAEYSRVKLLGYIRQVSEYLGVSDAASGLDVHAKELPESSK
jgi:hypothetical protein